MRGIFKFFLKKFTITMKFIKLVYAEMTKVVWPSQYKTAIYSAAVILVSLFVAYYLGLFDFLFQNYGLRTLL